jgi:L-fucose isomerase-like protein
VEERVGQEMVSIRVGICGAVHPNMPGDDRGVYKKVVSSMEKLQKDLGFELAVLNNPVQTETDAERARKFFDQEAVDITLIFNASLPFGRIMLPLARVNSFLGLWSVPEPMKSGVLQLNSFCGLNMLGSIIAHYLNEYDIPFKWFYDYPESALFQERFGITLRAMRAIKHLRESRIGQIGGLANGFENMYTDERVLERKFGTYIQTRHTVEDIVARARACEAKAVQRELERMLGEGEWVKKRVSREAMDKTARVSLALFDFAQENNYNALAVSCWPKFQEVYGVAVCAAMSRLNEAGIVAPCEADIAGAVNMLAFNAMNQGHAAFMDLVSLDDEDGSVNFWHCGVTCRSWADERGARWDGHFNIGSYEGDTWVGDGVVADLNLKQNTITVCTMDNNFDNLFILTGDVMPDKDGYFGGSGWVNNLKFNGSDLSIADLINTISVGRVNHHYAIAEGDLRDELVEFANWKGLRVMDVIPYQAYMQKPPVG